jgi:trans-aconitate 2-methyltransferase
MASWNPELYLRFGEERTRPAHDLAARARELLGDAADSRPRILDLGCGPGNSTAVLAAVFPRARISGLDSSPDMIAKARSSGLEAEWIEADAATFEPEGVFDLIFSNAVLQWVPAQEALLGRLALWLSPLGALAIQVPGNKESGLHQALLRTAASPAWRGRFVGLGESPRYEEPAFYFEVLEALGLSVDVWETTYWHTLAGPRAVIDWYSGSGMRPWLDRLPAEDDKQAFKDAVFEAASASYPPRSDGGVLFPFRRIFITAVRRRS